METQPSQLQPNEKPREQYDDARTSQLDMCRSSVPRTRTRDTFKFDALPVDEPTKAARGLPPNPKIKITLSNFDIEYLSGMSGVMLWQRILDSLVLDRFRLIFFDVRSCLAQRPQIPGHLGFVRQ